VKARQSLARAKQIMDRQMPPLAKMGAEPHDWFIGTILRREAEALISGKPCSVPRAQPKEKDRWPTPPLLPSRTP
jgi:hypothetical protein